MILEAAFVDPAYSWPPAEGQGKNAIELQAADDTDSVATSESLRQRMQYKVPVKKQPSSWSFLSCCKNINNNNNNNDTAVANQQARASVAAAKKEYDEWKRSRARAKAKKRRADNKYNLVPEGILVYRLDTVTRKLVLVSSRHHDNNDTTTNAILTDMTVAQASPSPDKSRRGILLQHEDGTTVTLVACEQRTATAWLEAMNLMNAKRATTSAAGSQRAANKDLTNKSSSWHKERLLDDQLDEIKDKYLHLANYSNTLIRAGTTPGQKNAGGVGGIYYSMQSANSNDNDDEALEAIAKRRAVIKDSWDFYRMICSLLRDRNKYVEVFRRLQLDPVYPFFSSMTGLNDPGEVGYENPDKTVMQADLPQYLKLSKINVAKSLKAQAEAAMPSLVEICKALAGSLGIEEVGVGPIKEVEAAVRKADKKYDGDLLKVTDYCRALLVVKDFPTLLALLELARDSFGPLIRRVKLSSLKANHKAKPGGYRDCIINLELKGHICEIQVHIWPMWVVCDVDGFRHYRHCVEYNTDSFDDAYDALEGLDRKTMAELIVMAEEAVAEIPLDNLEWYHEKYILDYFAEAGLFLKHGVNVWAELIFRHLIKLRTESPDIGPDHHETVVLYKYLSQSLRSQRKFAEADQVMTKVKAAEAVKNREKKAAQQSLWDSLLSAPTEALDMIIDPNRKEREEEEKFRKDVRASKKQWRLIRRERFSFLDASMPPDKNGQSADEKKSDEGALSK